MCVLEYLNYSIKDARKIYILCCTYYSMEKEIHIWDLLNMKATIAIDINETLKNEIGAKIRDNIYGTARELEIHPSRLFEYFIWKKSFIPLNILLNISSRLRIPNRKIERAIKTYKQLGVPSKNSIEKPKLPIKINPYLTSILSNLFFDGSVPKDGKGTYYNQKNEEIMKDFIKKVENIFGKVSHSLRLDHRGVLKLRIPRIIGEICRYIYNVKSFGSFDSRIPKRIFNMNHNHKVAFIITAILDEGSITYDGQIQFGVSNKNMMIDFENLCQEIGLETSPIKEGKLGRHHLYIKPLRKFHHIYIDFVKKYPLISLNYKEERLKKALEIKKQKFFYTKNFADKRKILILRELKKGEQTVNFLASKLLIPPKTVRRYMYRLMKENKLLRRKFGNEYIYFLDH